MLDTFSPPNVVEFKNNRIILTAICARMGDKVLLNYCTLRRTVTLAPVCDHLAAEGIILVPTAIDYSSLAGFAFATLAHGRDHKTAIRQESSA